MSGARETVCIDFDHVVHKYPGWQLGQNPRDITGTLMPGAKEAIKDLRRDYQIIIFSSRARLPAAARAIAKWLRERGIEVDGITATKVPAIVYIDDRGLTFDGDWDRIPQRVREFKAWRG